MTNQDRHNASFPRWETAAHARRRGNLAAAHRGERGGDGRYLAAYRRLLARHRRLIKLVGIATGTLVALVLLAGGALWWRLSSGPIQLDAFTPWLVSAIEENFGAGAPLNWSTSPSVMAHSPPALTRFKGAPATKTCGLLSLIMRAIPLEAGSGMEFGAVAC